MNESPLVESKETLIPDILPVLPIRNGVIFPNLVSPLVITTERSAKLVDEALAGDKLICAVTQKNPEIEDAAPGDIYRVGSVSVILKMLRFPDGTMRLLVQGLKRARIKEFVAEQPYLKAQVEKVEEVEHKDIAVEAQMRNVVSMFNQLATMSPNLPEELTTVAMNIESPAKLTDFIVSYVNFEVAEKQKFLETADAKERLIQLVPRLSKEISILELGVKIRDRVKGEMDKSQREYFLREQLKAIQKELGEVDERTAEVNELKEKIEKARMPDKVKETALKELERLGRMPTAAADYTVVRTYLDWLIALPWSVTTEDNLDIKRAKRILDEDHYNLKKVKERMLEYLAVKKLRNDSKGPIICLVGPPGVGKTSLGRSIARALGRKFVRFSLGGIRDEAEIRGHRRTYVGALPGRIVQGIRNAGSNNPVFMLDEIDKVGADFRGDPSSALLEVLDPEQNSSFSDHYLEVPFDLTKVMFITTANIADTIIPALRDRMETLELPGYVEDEKLEIARNFLLPRQLAQTGLTAENVKFTDEALSLIVKDYTREAGVRNLEREIGSILRKIARRFAEGRTEPTQVTPAEVRILLGPQKFFSEVAAREGMIGVSTGLSVTPYGGEILFVESSKMKGQKGLLLTGSLGEVMKESAQAAVSYIRTHAQEFRIDPDFFSNHDIHIHVPAGATPKDGPSAGVAIAASLMSLFREKPIDPLIAMTGEITLSGRVLPIGGVKEKVLAAKRAGITRIVLPAENKKDLIEIPAKVKRGLKFQLVKTISDVHRLLFSVPVRASTTKDTKSTRKG
jgi:ATP-dependent Lon protease